MRKRAHASRLVWLVWLEGTKMKVGSQFAWGIGLLIVCGAAVVGALSFRDEINVKATAAFAPSDSLIERGAYLARAGN